MKFTRVIIIVLIGFLLTSCGKEEKKQAEDLVPVKTVKVYKSSLIKPIITSGKVEASLESKLSFKISGIIESINYDEGDVVEKGAVIASLNLAEIKANVAKTEQGYEKAKRDFERVKNLYNDEVVTLEQYQNSETALEVAKSDFEIAKFNLEHSQIIAPTKGTILKEFANENEMINAGYPVVAFGSQAGSWKVIAAVSDQNLMKISIGDSVSASFDAVDNIVPGRVSTISKSANPYNGSYKIEINLDKADPNIASGMITNVKIFPHSEEQYYFIPIESLIEANDETGYVFILKGSSIEKKKVKIKDLVGNEVAVENGLEGIGEVVSAGASYLTENSKVKIVN
ncbi:MAG: efflux RND transporter periplasmic adaptor subunit [Ignavibacterium sp.]